jgi:hypothetical protein
MAVPLGHCHRSPRIVPHASKNDFIADYLLYKCVYYGISAESQRQPRGAGAVKKIIFSTKILTINCKNKESNNFLLSIWF